MAEPSVVRITGNPIVLGFPEDGTDETFKAGDLVALTTSGKLTIAAAGKILGIAKKDATGVDATVIPVDVVSPEGTFSCPLASGETAAQTIVGDERTFVFTAGAVTLHTTGTDTVILAMDPRSFSSGAGVAGGRMIFRFQSNLTDTPT